MALSSLTPLRPSPWRPRPLPAPWRENREPRRPSWATSVPEQPLSCRQRVPSEVSSADSHAVTELRGVAVTLWGHPPALKLSRPTWAAHVRPSSVPRAPAWAEVTGAWAGCVVGPPAAHGELGTLGSGPRSTWGQSLSRRLASSPSSGMWPGVGQGTGGTGQGWVCASTRTLPAGRFTLREHVRPRATTPRRLTLAHRRAQAARCRVGAEAPRPGEPVPMAALPPVRKGSCPHVSFCLKPGTPRWIPEACFLVTR